MKFKSILLFLTVVSILSACPFCTADPNDQSLDAYAGSAITLSMLPAFLLGIAFLIFRSIKKKFSVES